MKMVIKMTDVKASVEVIEKASGRGKPGDKPEIPKGLPRDKVPTQKESKS
jgi:hypothetical protein